MNARAAVDVDGFGGHTALFGTVVSQPNFWMNYNKARRSRPFAALLLEHGADPNARAIAAQAAASGIWAQVRHGRTYEYRDVTPLGWGERFHAKVFVSEPAMRMIRWIRGGR